MYFIYKAVFKLQQSLCLLMFRENILYSWLTKALHKQKHLTRHNRIMLSLYWYFLWNYEVCVRWSVSIIIDRFHFENWTISFLLCPRDEYTYYKMIFILNELQLNHASFISQWHGHFTKQKMSLVFTKSLVYISCGQ